jgi:hypothetical protein
MLKQTSDDSQINDLVQQIDEVVKKIKYGSVTLVIQDGRIIQIETHEKVRI